MSAYDVYHFVALCRQAARPVDRQALVHARTLMAYLSLSVDALAATNEPKLVTIIGNYRHAKPDRPVAFGNAPRLARAILRALSRLQCQFPDAGLPVVVEPADMCLRQLRPDLVPERSAADLKKWTLLVKRRGSTGGVGRGLSNKTIAEYPVTYCKILTACEAVGLTLTPTVGIAQVTAPECLDVLLPYLKGHFGEGIAPVLSALKRIAKDLLGEEHPNVRSLQASISRLFRPVEMDAARLAKARALVNGAGDPEIAGPTILEAARPMMARARRTGLRPVDMDSRAAAATAYAVFMSSPGMDLSDLASFHLTRSISGAGDARCLLRTGPSGEIVSDRLSAEAQNLLDELEALRRGLGLESPWLFPQRMSKRRRTTNKDHQTVQIAMGAVYSGLRAVTGKTFRLQAIKDLVGAQALDEHPQGDRAIASALNYRDTRSLTRRFRIVTDRPQRCPRTQP